METLFVCFMVVVTFSVACMIAGPMGGVAFAWLVLMEGFKDVCRAYCICGKRIQRRFIRRAYERLCS